MLEHPNSHTDYQGETGMDETMGNQQGTLTEGEIGWLAGIIEGEGSITMNVRRKEWKGWKGVGVDLQIYVVNTDAGIIEKAHEIFRKMNITPHVYNKTTNPIPRKDGDGFYVNVNKSMLILQVSKMNAILTILSNILPYMYGDKKHRAELISQFIQRRLSRQTDRSKGGDTWMDGYDWEIVKRFYEITKGRMLPEVEGLLRDHTRPMLSQA